MDLDVARPPRSEGELVQKLGVDLEAQRISTRLYHSSFERLGGASLIVIVGVFGSESFAPMRFWSPPEACISRMMSQPPTNFPST